MGKQKEDKEYLSLADIVNSETKRCEDFLCVEQKMPEILDKIDNETKRYYQNASFTSRDKNLDKKEREFYQSSLSLFEKENIVKEYAGLRISDFLVQLTDIKMHFKEKTPKLLNNITKIFYSSKQPILKNEAFKFLIDYGRREFYVNNNTNRSNINFKDIIEKLNPKVDNYIDKSYYKARYATELKEEELLTKDLASKMNR